MSIEIDRAIGARSFNAISTTLRTDVMLKTEHFTAATADVHGIGFVRLPLIGEYSHDLLQYLNMRP
ncbi:hypothetical protein C450_19501 [Halococcus salifodinae DSM 8989]|uniref:Uncharacterized protein n=1 Tax=Halococcus salifodinae DSM 8989 TaxID=1227456 RepID=M0MV18_9EURY|nr:hypothetical protein C450_19501 [Halococcus salifodinae DSM 8989]